MDPQQAPYQFRWLNVFEHTWACPFAICYLLFAISALAPLHPSAIGDRLSAIPSNLLTAPGDDGVPGASL